MPQRYTSRIIRVLTRRDYQPLKTRQLARTLKVDDAEYPVFRQAIDFLHKQGRIVFGSGNTLCLPEMADRIIGIYSAARAGFGFVRPKQAHAEGDLFIPPGANLDAVEGDTVEAEVQHRSSGPGGQQRRTGRVVAIVERAHTEFTGVLCREERQWFIQPDGRAITEPIAVDDPSAKDAKPGDKVVVEIVSWPTQEYYATGVITRRLGRAGASRPELQAVIHRFHLDEKFPRPALNEARAVTQEFQNTDPAAGRVDLRNELIVTVDPVDARDFDDAISLEKRPDGSWRLGVHIADVSYFVQPESELDDEAQKRATSVYLPQHVIPMLPELLSNGVCSLQEGRDRFTKSAWITFDKQGRVLNTEFANAVIRSTRRFTYEQVDDILDGKNLSLPKKLTRFVRSMGEAARVLHDRRAREGMLELDLPKAELVYDDKGHVIDAHPESSTFSHKMIEVFMLEANEAVARRLDSLNVPFLRRIHPEPDTLSFGETARAIQLAGFSIPKDLSREGIRDLLNSVRGRPEAFVINLLILKSMQRAEYSPAPMGHYAIASENYCHFTSPIRRYPDLTVHRLLDAWLQGRLTPTTVADFAPYNELLELGQHCSQRERNAEEAENDLREFKILQLMEKHVGEEIKAVVTSVVNFGLFVQCEKFLIEGMIRPEDLPRPKKDKKDKKGKKEKQKSRHAEKGRPHKGQKKFIETCPYKLGQELTVRITAVDLPGRFLRLTPVE